MTDAIFFFLKKKAFRSHWHLFEEYKEHFFQENANTSLSFVRNASLSNSHGHYTRVGH